MPCLKRCSSNEIRECAFREHCWWCTKSSINSYPGCTYHLKPLEKHIWQCSFVFWRPRQSHAQYGVFRQEIGQANLIWWRIVEMDVTEVEEGKGIKLERHSCWDVAWCRFWTSVLWYNVLARSAPHVMKCYFVSCPCEIFTILKTKGYVSRRSKLYLDGRRFAY